MKNKLVEYFCAIFRKKIIFISNINIHGVAAIKGFNFKPRKNK